MIPIERRPNVSTPSSRVPTDESRFKKNTHTDEASRDIVERCIARTHPGAVPSRYFGRALPGIQTSPAAARVVVVVVDDDLGRGDATWTARANVRAEANMMTDDEAGVLRGTHAIGSGDRSIGRSIDRSIVRTRDDDDDAPEEGPGACGATTGPPLNPSTIYHIIRIKTRSCTIYMSYYSCFVLASSWYFLYV